LVSYPFDVREATGVDRLVEQIVSDLGPPDILVNNAAIQPFLPIVDTSVELFRETLETNLLAPFAFLRAVIPRMRARRQGWIINIVSALAHRMRVDAAAYSASKRGLLALSEIAQLEHRIDGIHVSMISPGAVASGYDDVPASDPSKAGWLASEDIAAAVLWCLTRPVHARVDSLIIHPMIQDAV
jgi:NAD(P)-dependent dehydrogenase (short-subunit alcohol dehydrogenase family)